jgi:hypothetical protein
VDRPIFFVGMPRSGTTVIFHLFAAHPDLAWFSQLHERFPSLPSLALLSRLADLSPAARKAITVSEEHRPWLEKLRIGPSEAYGVWDQCCGEKFRYGFLLGERADAAERRRTRKMVAAVTRYHGRPRFSTKITGPARIGYVSSIFPDARFVHVIRDGRAVVQSLLRIGFWRDTFRLREPAWRGGLTEDDLQRWRAAGESPLALAAIEWGAVIAAARQEAGSLAAGRYAEVRYEQFVAEPEATIRRILEHCRLEDSSRHRDLLERRIELRDRTETWRQRFDRDQLRMLEGLIGEQLADLGYES